MNLVDIIGPVMIGPSSSHTAGAVRLGLLAASILGGKPVKAEINLHGSFAETYQGHGTDMALLAGLMGWMPDDERIPEAASYAASEGLVYSFNKIDLGNMAHPNTVLFKLTSASGSYCEIIGSSVGGGQVKVTEIDGFPVELTGRLPAILTVHIDTRGVIALVTMYFQCQISGEAPTGFDGLSLIRWSVDGKIAFLQEYACTEKRYCPYG